MLKLLIIGNLAYAQNRVRATITYVTLNTINSVVVVKISFVKGTKQKAKHLDLLSTEMLILIKFALHAICNDLGPENP